MPSSAISYQLSAISTADSWCDADHAAANRASALLPLQEPEENQVPRVSTYRMAGHLATAFTIFSALVRGMLWVASCC